MPPDTALPNDRPPADGWATIRRFLPYLWPSDRPDLKRRIIGAMVMVLLAKGVVLATPLAMKYAVDAMAGAGDTGRDALWLVATGFVLAYAGARFLSVGFDNIRNVIFERVGQVATTDLAEDVFRRLHRLSLRFHLSRRTGEVTKTIERGTKTIDSMLYFLLFNIAPTIIELIAVGIIFYTLFGAELVIATAAVVVVYIAITRWITEWRTKLRAQMNAMDGTALGRAVDSLLNYETVKYFGAESREQDRYASAAREYQQAAVKSENSLGLLNIVQSFITNALMAGAMAFVVWDWSRGNLTVGDLTAVNMYLMQLFRPLDMLGWVYRTIRQGLVDMAEMFRLIDTEVEVEDVPGAPALTPSPPTIAFENVVFGYDPERTILHGLSFEVAAGSRTAIVGPSGAGKSTIGRLLFRFYDPQAGRILVAGQDIAKVRQDSLRRAIGIVPQDSVLFNDTLGYNIAYGLPSDLGTASEQQIIDAARDAAILPFIERLPGGMDTQVGERGLKLSGGEKQRVAIARTLLKDPPILLFDEATSALDSRTEQEILATLDRVSRDRTALAIAHRLSTIADADEILVLNEGRLEERGTHAQLLRRDGLYAEMWARQQSDGDARAEAAE